MSTNWRALTAAAILAITIGRPTGAVSVDLWSASTSEQLARGTLDGTALDGDGFVRIAPAVETLWGPDRGIVWAVAPAGPRAAFVALSGPARVLRVERDRPAETWFEATEEALVTALDADGEGGVVLGLSPDGRILHARRTGAGTVEVASVGETSGNFIWALALPRN